jgi:ankyrin repeat protein
MIHKFFSSLIFLFLITFSVAQISHAMEKSLNNVDKLVQLITTKNISNNYEYNHSCYKSISSLSSDEINTKINNQYSLLEMAIVFNRTEIATLLSKNGADSSFINTKYRQLLRLVIQKNNVSLLSLILIQIFNSQTFEFLDNYRDFLKLAIDANDQPSFEVIWDFSYRLMYKKINHESKIPQELGSFIKNDFVEYVNTKYPNDTHRQGWVNSSCNKLDLEKAPDKNNKNLNKLLDEYQKRITNKKDYQRHTPLEAAIIEDNIDIAEVLLNAGAKITYADIETACKLNHDNMAKILVEDAFKKNYFNEIINISQEDKLITLSVNKNNMELLGLIIDNCNEFNNIRDANWDFCLVTAIDLNNRDAYKFIYAKFIEREWPTKRKRRNLKRLIINSLRLIIDKSDEDILLWLEIFENIMGCEFTQDEQQKIALQIKEIKYRKIEPVFTGKYCPPENNNTINDDEKLLEVDKVKDKLIEIFKRINDVNIREHEKDIILSFKKDDIANIVFSAIQSSKFSATKNGNKISVTITYKNVTEIASLKDAISQSIKVYLKKQNKEELVNNNSNASTEGFPSYDNRPKEPRIINIKPPKNKPKKDVTQKKILNPQDPPKDKSKKPKGNKPSRTIKVKTKVNTIKPTIDIHKQKNKKRDDILFFSSYHLSDTHKYINPTLYPSAFIEEEKDMDSIIVSPNKKVDYEPIALFELYSSILLDTLNKDERLGNIWAHGILAIDFTRVENDNYLKFVIDSLLKINEDIIILDGNKLYRDFSYNYSNYLYSTYLANSSDQRLAQIKALVSYVKSHGQEMFHNQAAIDGILFILGEHFARLFYAQESDLIKDVIDIKLANKIKAFRNAVKHEDEDHIIINGNASFVIEKENIADKGPKLLQRLIKHLQKPAK